MRIPVHGFVLSRAGLSLRLLDPGMKDGGDLQDVQANEEQVPTDYCQYRLGLRGKINNQHACGRNGQQSQFQYVLYHVGKQVKAICHIYQDFHRHYSQPQRRLLIF
jgi:hypothetical protein